MNILSFNKTNKWRKKPPNKTLFFPISLLVLLLSIFIISFYLSQSSILKSLFLNPPKTLTSQTHQCTLKTPEKFLFFAPHSGFSNQLSELKNAILISAILNRTLIVPPILDHHAVALGSCPKFRVLTPNELRFKVWNHTIHLLQSRRYVSMADIVDLSSLPMIRVIDFRVFAYLWCDIKIDTSCLNLLEAGSSSLNQCGILLSGMEGNVGRCLYALEDDCGTTVWTYNQNIEDDGVLDSFQPDEQLRRKKKVEYVRRRRDVYKALGPGSEAGLATVLAFGSLFTAPYKGSELYIDIHEAPGDPVINSLIRKIDRVSFVPEIMNAGKEFVAEKVKSPFLCAQLRLLDGQFKNHWKATFLGLKQKLESLRKDSSLPIHIFVMTDLPEANWTDSFLGELTKKSDTYRLHNLREGDQLIVRTAEKIARSGHGMRTGFLPRNLGASKMKNSCPLGILPDILLYVEEAVCSCASMGFVGTVGSTIAESIELMRKNGICSSQV